MDDRQYLVGHWPGHHSLFPLDVSIALIGLRLVVVLCRVVMLELSIKLSVGLPPL